MNSKTKYGNTSQNLWRFIFFNTIFKLSCFSSKIGSNTNQCSVFSDGRRWGVFNLTLYSTIWEFIATSTWDCSGIKWLICLCCSPPHKKGEHFLVYQKIFLWALHFIDRLLLAHCTTSSDINLCDPVRPHNTLTQYHQHQVETLLNWQVLAFTNAMCPQFRSGSWTLFNLLF